MPKVKSRASIYKAGSSKAHPFYLHQIEETLTRAKHNP